MPEGPSIVILSEQLLQFEGSKVLHATGNAKIDMDRIKGQVLEHCLSWGKHTLLCFDDCYLRQGQEAPQEPGPTMSQPSSKGARERPEHRRCCGWLRCRAIA